MKHAVCHPAGVWILLLSLLLVSCGKEKYHYPSVKLEFVTIHTGMDGRLQSLLPDEGEALPIYEDRTKTVIKPDTVVRVLSNYEVLPEGAKVYSLRPLIAPTPKPTDDPAYKDGIKTDPVEMVSIWMGRDYLNMILNLKVNTGKGYSFGIVEETSRLATEGVVQWLLYHDANGDAPYYNRRAYVSVPVSKYIGEARPDGPIRIQLVYYTYDKSGNTVVSRRYADPGFEYIPTGKKN